MLINVTKFMLFKFQTLLIICFYSSELLAWEKNKIITPSESLLPMVVGLLAILAVIFALAFVFRKFSNFGLAGKNIKIVESQMIGNKEKLMVVQVQQQQFLIGVTGHTISQLGKLDQKIVSYKEKVDNGKKHNTQNDFDIGTLPFGKIISQLIKGPIKASIKEEQSQRQSISSGDVV